MRCEYRYACGRRILGDRNRMNDDQGRQSPSTIDQLEIVYKALFCVLAASVTDDHLSKDEFGNRIPFGSGYGPNFVNEPDEGSWVERAGHGFDLRVVDRGVRRNLLWSATADDVLFAVFKSITQTLATNYEARHRIPGEDSRQQWFKIQEDMMRRLVHDWGERLQAGRPSLLRRP